MNGPAFAILAALLFGLSAPLAKNLLGAIDPWLIAGILYFGSGIGMAIIEVGRRLFYIKSPLPKIEKNEFFWLLGVTLFGGILGPVFLMYGIAVTPASTASLLLNLEGILTSVIAWTVFHEHFERRIILGMASIVFGGIVLSWTSNPSFAKLLGPMLVALACLCWGIDNNLTRKISLNDPVLLTMIKSLVAGTTNTAIALIIGTKIPVLSSLLEAGLLGFLSYGLSLVCFILALRHLGASRTGAYFSSAPFMGAAMSILIFHEAFTFQLALAASFMIVGIYLHLSENHEHLHTHEELEHDHLHAHDEHHQHDHCDLDPRGEPHSHYHRHTKLVHCHRHFPDMHHMHEHKKPG